MAHRRIPLTSNAAMRIGDGAGDRAGTELGAVMQTLQLLAAARLARLRFAGEFTEMKAGRTGLVVRGYGLFAQGWCGFQRHTEWANVWRTEVISPLNIRQTKLAVEARCTV